MLLADEIDEQRGSRCVGEDRLLRADLGAVEQRNANGVRPVDEHAGHLRVAPHLTARRDETRHECVDEIPGTAAHDWEADVLREAGQQPAVQRAADCRHGEVGVRHVPAEEQLATGPAELARDPVERPEREAPEPEQLTRAERTRHPERAPDGRERCQERADDLLTRAIPFAVQTVPDRAVTRCERVDRCRGGRGVGRVDEHAAARRGVRERERRV